MTRNPVPRRTTLTDMEYKRCLRITKAYVRKNGSIQNRQVRKITGLNYDHAIAFFGRATNENQLVRQGKGSATCYVKVDTQIRREVSLTR